jgi:hypothetical protein
MDLPKVGAVRMHQALRVEAISDFASTIAKPAGDTSRLHRLLHHPHHVVR